MQSIKNCRERFKIKRYKSTGTIAHKEGSGPTSTLSGDDETIATQLQVILATHNLYISLATIDYKIRVTSKIGCTWVGWINKEE